MKHQLSKFLFVTVLVCSVTEIREGYEYQVLFRVNGSEYRILVTLTSDFPAEKPILKVTPLIAHPWVSPEGEITSAPGLLNVSQRYKTICKNYVCT